VIKAFERRKFSNEIFLVRAARDFDFNQRAGVLKYWINAPLTRRGFSLVGQRIRVIIFSALIKPMRRNLATLPTSKGD
jgi:hypothetical protein